MGSAYVIDRKLTAEKSILMKLVIFDIDGTLTQTSAIDELCFRAAYSEMLELHDISLALESCPHISDTGITRYIYQTHKARAPHDHEEAAICNRVVALLIAVFKCVRPLCQ